MDKWKKPRFLKKLFRKLEIFERASRLWLLHCWREICSFLSFANSKTFRREFIWHASHWPTKYFKLSITRNFMGLKENIKWPMLKLILVCSVKIYLLFVKMSTFFRLHIWQNLLYLQHLFYFNIIVIFHCLVNIYSCTFLYIITYSLVTLWTMVPHEMSSRPKHWFLIEELLSFIISRVDILANSAREISKYLKNEEEIRFFYCLAEEEGK